MIVFQKINLSKMNDRSKFPDQSALGYLKLEEHDPVFIHGILENPQATNEDEIPGATGSFGLEPCNPIPIHGVPNSSIYLDSLYLADGKPITYRRVGSVWESSIELPIDEYQIYDAEGNEINKIYISPYHLKCSEKTPQGFTNIDKLLDLFFDDQPEVE